MKNSSAQLEAAVANPWTTLSPRVAWEGPHYRLREDRVIQPNGEESDYVYVEPAAEFVVIVPVSTAGTTFLVRQWRYVWNRSSWEAPAGVCEAGEEPLFTAQRELAEEAGLQAQSWSYLGRRFNSAAFSRPYHVYLAEQVAPVPHAVARDGSEQDMIVREIPFADALEAAADGTIVHAPSAVALLRASRALNQAR